MESSVSKQAGGEFNFLAGGGEMGALMRAHDWNATPLGPPERWPQSLKTAVRIMLTSRQPIWIGWGPDLIYLYNDPYKSIIGGKHPWALGKPTSTVWQEIWGDIGPMLATAMTGIEGTYVEEQLLIMERNGYPEETYYTFSYSPIPDDDGSAGGIICANTDDTQRVIGERQLALLRRLAADASEARTSTEARERSLRALSINRRDLPFALLYDLTPDGDTFVFAGSCGLDGEHPTVPKRMDPERMQWPLHQALRTQQPVVVEDLADKFPDGLPTGDWRQSARQAVLLPILPNGETSRAAILVVGLNPFRLFDEGYRGFLELAGGQIAATIANAQAYEEEKRRAQALEEINRQKTAFFSNVSHEFRTPLTLMLGPLEDLLADPEMAAGAEGRALVEVAHRNALRLLKLVNSLLDFSRLEAGRARADFEPVDLAAFTAELASNFRSVAQKAGLKLEVEGDKLDAPVYVDRDMWEKVVLNLLSNAFKFTLEGSICLSLRATADGKSVELSVTDTGAGIAADQLPKLFDRFYQVGGQKGRSFEGSGIGLALVKEIATLHGGSVEVESEPGRGSSFKVRIPSGIAHLPPEQIVMDTPAIGLTAKKRANAYVEEALRWIDGATPVDPGIGGAEKPRILIADDNADMRDYIARLLGDRWTTELVEDGVAALDAINTNRPDLVLTDVMMPKLDGFGLLKAIRGDNELRDLPVIMRSARAGEEARVEGLDAGADDYLTKPFSARELVAQVGANLKLAEVRRQARDSLKLANDQLAADKETVDRLNRQLASESDRLRDLFEQAPGFMCVLRGANHVFELANGAYLKLVGERDLIGKQVREAFPDVEGQDFFGMLDSVYATGEPVEGRSRPIQLQRNGRPELRYLDFIYQPIVDQKGLVTGIFVEGYDVTDRVIGQSELAEREAEFRALADNMSQFAWMTDEVGMAYWFNRRWLDYTGTSLADMKGWGWRVALHPDHADGVLAKIKVSFMSGESWEDTFPIRNKDGEYRWFLSRALPIRDADGRIIRWFGTNTDITERLKADEQRGLLINELNHRVKNTLATVQSLAMQTLRNTERSADARELFESRLTALSRAHNVLTVESWEGAKLRQVADRAMEPFKTKDGRVSVDGKDVWLTPKQTLALSMALHELATNATKYGALSNEAGTVRVSWVVAPFDGTGQLELTWTEQGGPPVSPPTRKGFGTRLIQRNLAHDLGGDATIDFRPQGVVAVIHSPIEKPHQGNQQ